MQKLILIISIFCLIGCSDSRKNDPNSLLKNECQSSSKGSVQCKIYQLENLNDIEKISSLGILYLFGNGKVEKNYEKSFYYLKIAQNFNDAEAVNGLGIIYMFGLGQKKDLNKAEDLFKKASELGDKEAKNNLGELFRIKNNNMMAEYWFNLGIQDSPAKAYEGLSKIYLEQNKFSEAYGYVLQAAELGNIESEYNLGVFYEQGIYVTQNIDKAKYWYSLAAQKGHVDAKNNLNVILNNIN